MLSFSSCWNNSRHSEGDEMIDEIVSLGFEDIELSHGMTISKLPGIQKGIPTGKVSLLGSAQLLPLTCRGHDRRAGCL